MAMMATTTSSSIKVKLLHECRLRASNVIGSDFRGYPMDGLDPMRISRCMKPESVEIDYRRFRAGLVRCRGMEGDGGSFGLYVVVFCSALAVDLIPVIAPPAWTIMVFLLMKFDLNPWIVLLVGVPGSTLGRYIFSLYIPKFTDKIIKRHKKEELEFLGKRLGQKLWMSWLFVFVYTLTPLSTSALFTAAAIARVNPVRTVPPFFCGKFISDAVLIFTGQYAAGNMTDLLHGTFSLKGILAAVVGLLIVGGFLFVNWRVFLQRGKFKFNFKIWK
jgi:membrane protein YqaA with SNARE-associated domain